MKTKNYRMITVYEDDGTKIETGLTFAELLRKRKELLTLGYSVVNDNHYKTIIDGLTVLVTFERITPFAEGVYKFGTA